MSGLPRRSRLRDGNILLLLIGIITVMLAFSFGFLRSMQLARSGAQLQRQQKLADLAASMGQQHALAVTLHEYAMHGEIGDPDPADGQPPGQHGLQAARSRLDSPSRTVFGLLSPRVSTVKQRQQPPTPYDLPPDLSFNDLYMGFSGVTRPRSGYKSAAIPVILPGYSTGWTMQRGYGRYIEANRFDYSRASPYDPSTYDLYDPAAPNAAVVRTPFPPVDPFVRGAGIIRRHDLDGPLLLDADFRPLPPARATESRYRLRYVVSSYDQSADIWLNTDPPWLKSADKAAFRNAYREAVYSVGEQWAWSTKGHTNGGHKPYGPQMEGVLLGYGQYGNVRFTGLDGIPKEWASRGGLDTGYRKPSYSGAEPAAVLANVHGSPFMSWFDGGAWRGSALTSWNDLAFAVRDASISWAVRGETGSASWDLDESMMRADPVSHHVLTPFGRPYEAATACPWQVNALVAPMRVLGGMVGAYMPPAVRSGFYGSVPVAPLPATQPVLQMAVGSDLFTESFTVGGVSPFINQGASPKVRHPAPADRDYWTCLPVSRPNHTQPEDNRPNVVVAAGVSSERYPGGAFHESTAAGYPEAVGRQSMRWRNVVSDPPQLYDDPASAGVATAINTTIQAYPNPVVFTSGLDHLGRHIAFYTPSANAAASPALPAMANNTTNALYSAAWKNPKVTPWANEFTPIAPFGIDGTRDSWETPSVDSGAGPQAFYPYWIFRKDQNVEDTLRHLAPNSYWNRISVAFVHAVVVAQIANLSYRDPADARSSDFWPADGYANPTSGNQNNDAAGIIYNRDPRSVRTVTKAMRKGTGGWDPRAAHFATLAQIDRQFLANLGESFEDPGWKRPSQVRLEVDPTTGAPRPPRFSRCVSQAASATYTDDQRSIPSPSSFAYGSSLWVGEYHVSNNIRTLLLPVDGTDTVRNAMVLASAPPHNLWLLDEWNVGAEADYVPGTSVSPIFAPTQLALARAKLMERVLNDWRMSFLGASKGYADDFRPKDFDGDGKVFCSGYLGGTAEEPITRLTCWQLADAAGNGPGIGTRSDDPAYINPTASDPAKRLTLFSLTGCLAIARSHQFKLLVRGELFDNLLGKPVAERHSETAVLIDPDNNVVRSANPAVLPSGLGDTTIIMQRPVHSYYRGYLAGSGP